MWAKPTPRGRACSGERHRAVDQVSEGGQPISMGNAMGGVDAERRLVQQVSTLVTGGMGDEASGFAKPEEAVEPDIGLQGTENELASGFVSGQLGFDGGITDGIQGSEECVASE
jgi:hypothetical protein